MRQLVNSDAAPVRYLKRAEAAERCRVSLPTFDKLRRADRIPGPDASMGKHMLWKEETIDAFLASGGTGGVMAGALQVVV